MFEALNSVGSAILAPLRGVTSLITGAFSAVTGVLGGGLNMAVTGAISGIGALSLGYLFKDPIKQGLEAGGFDETAQAIEDFERNNPNMGTMIMKAAGYGAGAGIVAGAAPVAIGATLAGASSLQAVGATIGGAATTGALALGIGHAVEAATGAQVLPDALRISGSLTRN